MDDKVGMIGEHLLISRVVAVLVLLAGREVDAQALETRIVFGSGPSAAHRTSRLARGEAVPVLTRGLEIFEFDMHAVCPVRIGIRRACAYDASELIIARDLPGHWHCHRRHPAVWCERFRRKTGPEHEAIGPWITRRHPESERIALEW